MLRRFGSATRGLRCATVRSSGRWYDGRGGDGVRLGIIRSSIVGLVAAAAGVAAAWPAFAHGMSSGDAGLLLFLLALLLSSGLVVMLFLGRYLERRGYRILTPFLWTLASLPPLWFVVELAVDGMR